MSSQFFSYPAALGARFKTEGNTIRYAKAQTFVRPEDESPWVYLLEDGLCEISCGFSDGSNRLLGYFFPGAVFAQNGSFFDNGGSGLEYTTAQDSTVLRLPKQRFFQLLSEDAACSKEYIEVLLRNQFLLIERIALMGEHGIERMVIRLLIGLCRYYGRQDKTRYRIDIPITQETIARFTHATRESVSKTLRQLMRQNIISLENKQLSIIDMPALEALLH